MKKIISLCSVLLSINGFMACSTEQCKGAQGGPKSISSTELEKSISGAATQMNKIKIFKTDGSLQCNQGEKIALNVMSKELLGIQVFSSENKHDGLMRIQLCGKPTGYNNVYEINSADLPKALALGFKKWIRE